MTHGPRTLCWIPEGARAIPVGAWQGSLGGVQPPNFISGVRPCFQQKARETSLPAFQAPLGPLGAILEADEA